MTSRRSNTDRTENCLLRSYVRGEVVVVYKTKEDFGGLSNMAPGYPLQILPLPPPTRVQKGNHRAAQPDARQDEEQATPQGLKARLGRGPIQGHALVPPR